MDKIKDAFEIILNSVPELHSNKEKLKKYFIEKWLMGSNSPDIWNHHNTSRKRTNNNLEGYHTTITSTLPKYHPEMGKMVQYYVKRILVNA